MNAQELAMNAQQLADQLNEFKQKAIDTANTYHQMAKVAAKKLIKEFGLENAQYYTKEAEKRERIYGAFEVRSYSSSDPYDTVEFNGTRFTASYEYNDACNCHPEYRTWEISLPIEWLDLEGDALRAAINERLDVIEKKLRAEFEADAKKKAEEEQKKADEAARKERETYESLKAKYEK